VVSGAILAGASDLDVQRLSRYAQAIGLAFQIVDDILDLTSTQEELGKSIGKDERAQKATYPKLWGIEESRQQAQNLIDQAKSEVVGFGENAIPLMVLADYITARTH
jgi:geranylgeranyl diphosphate synthase type II